MREPLRLPSLLAYGIFQAAGRSFLNQYYYWAAELGLPPGRSMHKSRVGCRQPEKSSLDL